MQGSYLFSRRRERGSIAKLFSETEESLNVPSSTEGENISFVSQPSLKMIRRLKRLSDAWSNISRCTDDVITDRLKRGREEAIRKRTYIEVCYCYDVQGAVSLRKFIGGWYHVCNNVAVRILEFSN
jgi:hypothetical protein